MKKKVAFITGSSRGIGFFIASKLLQDGFEVILNSSNLKRLKQSSKKLGNCKYYVGDITNKNSIKTIFNKIKKNKIKLDVLICNYGNSKKSKNDEDIYLAFKNNFFSATNTIQKFQNILNKNAKIICISSICGVEIIKGAPLGYSVAKSALNSFVKFYADYLGEKASINSIALGNMFFEGSLWQKKLNSNPKKIKDYINKFVPKKKFGKIEDINEICNFLINQKNNYTTGSTFIIDGGQTRKF
jgi:NAD(P)-dependent dehydrogenase (short-subunit alcohol dehydrogenase family)